MPLSEHEQKILEEIERRLIEDDPALPGAHGTPRSPPTCHAGSGWRRSRSCLGS